MSLQTQAERDLENQPLNFYVDLNIIQNDPNSTEQAVPIRFTSIKNEPFLKAPKNYEMAIVRFGIDTTYLPSVIPLIQKNQGNRDLTEYSFTLSYDYLGTTYNAQQYIIFEPQNSSATLPVQVNGNWQTANYIEYYFINTFQKWFKMVNKALSDAYTTLDNIITGLGGALPSSHPPFFEVNPSTLVVNLNADILGYSDDIANPIKIFMNNSCYGMFSNFQVFNFGQSASNGKNYKFSIYSVGGPTISTNSYILPTYTALQMFSEGESALSLIQPVQSLVFTSSLLPVVNTAVDVPLEFNATNLQESLGNNSGYQPVLTDYVVPWTAQNTYKSQTFFQTAGEYRFQDLYGASPLQTLELFVFWKSRWGFLYPMKLKQGAGANLKLYFRRKDFYAFNLRV